MSPEDLKIKGGSRKSGRSEKVKKISAILDRLAKQKGTVMASIALAYVMHTILYVLLVTRGRNIEHFRGNIEALKIYLFDDEMDEVGSSAPFDLGFHIELHPRGWECAKVQFQRMVLVLRLP